MPANEVERILDDRQRLESQEIHFEQPEVVERVTSVLCDDLFFLVSRERDVLVKGAVTDDDAGRVDARAARKPFED